LSIKIYYDQSDSRVKGWRKIKSLIGDIVENAGKKVGDINIVITNDESLRKINVQFLEHDYYTDVITFNYNEGDLINGEIYISADTVRENSKEYNATFNSELTRVIIHGVLHLVGLDDKTDEQRSEMRSHEDRWLAFLKNN
jgi:rRNA maturation RNase YbeY